MRVVVDSNIAISAILKSNSSIIKSGSRVNFYSTEQILNEIDKHKLRLLSMTEYTLPELNRAIELICSRIRFINVKLISNKIYNNAINLVSNIDIDDIEFVALTDHVSGKLWSGDKVLRVGLGKKGWNKFTSTEELYTRVLKN